MHRDEGVRVAIAARETKLTGLRDAVYDSLGLHMVIAQRQPAVGLENPV